jgi:hypothetical protein
MALASAPRRGGHAADHRRLVLVAVLVAVVLVLAVTVGVLLARGRTPTGSGSQGSGVAATQTRALASFSRLDLAGANSVAVTVGRPQSVTVHGDSNLLGRVTTQVTSGTLIIGENGGFTTKVPMNVEVSVPSLTLLTLSGDGQVTVIGLSAAQLTVTVSGDGLLSAAGTATRLSVSLPGDGQAQLSELTARDVHAVLSGSGLIQVTATNSLDAAVPGTGAVIYGGDPAHVTTSITGTGTVIHG